MNTLNCPHFSLGRCRSCSRLALAPEDRFRQKFSSFESRLKERFGAEVFIEPAFIPHSIFPSRTKAKMSVSGSLDSPCIGILDNELKGTELLDCPLHAPIINRALEVIKPFITEFKLTPYDIESKRGELKGIILKSSGDGGSLMVRFVVRSTEAVPRIRKAALKLMEAIPEVCAVTANIQPVPHAILEGPEEIHLAGSEMLWERYGSIELAFSAQSFAQVTHETAEALYRHVTSGIARMKPDVLVDLFCGVGGFGMFAAEHCTKVIGVELSAAAIGCATAAAKRNNRTNIEFVSESVDEFLRRFDGAVDAVVCNPPRRGLGRAGAAELERLRPEVLFYSSCNPESLFTDITALPNYRPVRFAPFEMFPLTEHIEVVCELHRTAAPELAV